MSTLSRIEEFLARTKQARLLNENSASIDAGLVKMIVDALPELAFNEEFRTRLSAMLADKMDDGKITKITQVLVTELPARAEAILKSMVV